MEKISVIVPVYNSEAYLENCLNSIIQQTYQNLEIILVNDGSTDGSAAICQRYKIQDPRVKVYHKPNGGVGSSRNRALEAVTGDYILFVDNDDWLELDHIDDYFESVYSPFEWFQHQYDGQYNLSQCFTVPWAKLYKAELFKEIVYPTDKTVEDDYTTYKVYLQADKIVYMNRAIYLHRKRETSVTKTVNLADVYPLQSIEERMMILQLIGAPKGLIDAEIAAYKWRLAIHEEETLKHGDMEAYQQVLVKKRIKEKSFHA